MWNVEKSSEIKWVLRQLNGGLIVFHNQVLCLHSYHLTANMKSYAYKVHTKAIYLITAMCVLKYKEVYFLFDLNLEYS